MSYPKQNQIAANPKEAAQYIAWQAKEIEKLRNALAPFAYLRQNELRPGDFNRARRVLALFKTEAAPSAE